MFFIFVQVFLGVFCCFSFVVFWVFGFFVLLPVREIVFAQLAAWGVGLPTHLAIAELVAANVPGGRHRYHFIASQNKKLNPRVIRF